MKKGEEGRKGAKRMVAKEKKRIVAKEKKRKGLRKEGAVGHRYIFAAKGTCAVLPQLHYCQSFQQDHTRNSANKDHDNYRQFKKLLFFFLGGVPSESMGGYMPKEVMDGWMVTFD